MKVGAERHFVKKVEAERNENTDVCQHVEVQIIIQTPPVFDLFSSK